MKPNRNSRFFPWRLFKKIVLSQLALSLPVLGFLILGSHLYFEYRTPVFQNTQELVEGFNRVLLIIFTVSVITFIGASIWSGIRLAGPLGRIILRTRRMSRKDFARKLSRKVREEDAHNEEPGELSDLEIGLNRIEKRLIRKDERISKELGEIETLMGALSDAILAVDLDGRPLFFNSQFAVLFGGDHFHEKRPRLRELFRTPEILETFEKAIQENRTLTQLTEYRKNPGDQPQHFSISVAPLMKKNENEIYGGVGIFHDITELKRAEQIRIDFVSNVSHELRTPLTSIKGYADTLRDDVKNQNFSEAEQFLQVINRNVDRLMNLVNDLLDLSSLESGAHLTKEIVNTQELTERVLTQLETKRSHKKQDIQTSVETETVLGDPKRIEQVMVNLVENAIKYVPDLGTIKIQWKSHPTLPSALLLISDNGPGIDPTHLPRLFERFYRVDKDRSRQIGGTGLGLAIAKHIMQRHGGSIEVKSKLGQGTQFTCRFPNE